MTDHFPGLIQAHKCKNGEIKPIVWPETPPPPSYCNGALMQMFSTCMSVRHNRAKSYKERYNLEHYTKCT